MAPPPAWMDDIFTTIIVTFHQSHKFLSTQPLCHSSFRERVGEKARER